VYHFTHLNQHDQTRVSQGDSPYARQQPQQEVNKISWKKVAEYMAELGSYKFGNATVKKKYLELVDIGCDELV